MHALRLFRRQRRGLCDPVLALDRHALRNRRALRQDTGEIHIVPMRREMNPAVAIVVAIDESAQGRERQIETIERMSEQQRIALRGFDGPQIMKLDHEAIELEQRRTGHLACVMESDWRARKIELSAGREIIVPGDLAPLDLEIADQR